MAYAKRGSSRMVMMAWKNMLNNGRTPDLIAYTSMIRGLCEAGMVDGGMRLLNDMLARGDVEPDAVTYNVLFHGLLEGGNLTRAMDLLGRMLDRGCDPDPVTCNIFLKWLVVEGKGREFLDGLVVRLIKRGRVEGASEIVEVMLRKCLAPEASTWEKVLRGVCKRKKVWRIIDSAGWRCGDKSFE
ncbi:pentatricopeptide repeat-containing protein At4g20090-like [Phoenix dactylifera]|uniref:Pentatricopeptide repeat-containing protein At4g20090-like n=1 Tax=Phoenix dactylifera TaxID=42345 RepID=A0A8B9A0Y7_PHODC|nr:pentatricopeptide repeat-containing protein At4g20090-like [Phoenix dactylifera]